MRGVGKQRNVKISSNPFTFILHNLILRRRRIDKFEKYEQISLRFSAHSGEKTLKIGHFSYNVYFAYTRPRLGR